MDVLLFSTLVVTGFISCAEFGSYAFVHPILRPLPARERIMVEQGLLRTFGRIMPFGMTLCVILVISLAIHEGGVWYWLAAASYIAAVTSTVIVNVPINLATGRWDKDNPPADWETTRNKWDFFQAVRSWLLLVGFVLISVGVTV